MGKDRESTGNGQIKFAFLKRRNSKTKILHAAENALLVCDTIEDPRTRPCDDPLREILFIAAMAYLCDAESYEDIATLHWVLDVVPSVLNNLD